MLLSLASLILVLVDELIRSMGGLNGNGAAELKDRSPWGKGQVRVDR